MKPEELDQALATGFVQAQPAKLKEPSPTTPLAEALKVDAAAMTFARKWKLVRADGTVKCINDWCGGDGTLPTLECRECRESRECKASR